jgi:hypothetical protein
MYIDVPPPMHTYVVNGEEFLEVTVRSCMCGLPRVVILQMIVVVNLKRRHGSGLLLGIYDCFL